MSFSKNPLSKSSGREASPSSGTWTLRRHLTASRRTIWTRSADLIPQYDFVLTYGGGQPVIDGYRQLGARLCVPIYNALDPSTHYPVPPETRFESDLGFLGNRLPDREARVQEFLFRAAERLPDRSFILGGNGWEDKSVPPNVRKLGHVYTADHNAFNCTPRAVLNISRESMARYGYSPATRVFEAAGAAACIITDAWQGIDAFLEPDREILVAQDGLEVADQLFGTHNPAGSRTWLESPAARTERTHVRTSSPAVGRDPVRVIAAEGRAGPRSRARWRLATDAAIADRCFRIIDHVLLG